MPIDLPARGFVFWPVGTGDSTTVKVNENVVMQVDIHHMTAADDDEEPFHPVVDTLVEEVLPTREGEDRPYLAVFALTHPDTDHCKGFKDLLDRTIIGELWFAPRVLRDYKDNADSSSDVELCDDAVAFAEEAVRRIELNQGSEADSGDRIRIIGSDDILEEDEYKNIPEDRKSRPGETVTVLDGVDLEGTFQVFLHSPFGDDSTKERNKTSLGMQVTITEGDASGRAMLLGDLDYPPLKRIFVELSDDDDKAWDVFLAPHHCSKSGMYFQDVGDDEAVLKQLAILLEKPEPNPGSVPDGWCICPGDERRCASGCVGHWRMQRCVFRIEFAYRRGRQPFEESLQVPEHPTAGIPFALNRLVEAQRSAPLDVCKSFPPTVRDPGGRGLKWERVRHDESEAFPLPDLKASRQMFDPATVD